MKKNRILSLLVSGLMLFGLSSCFETGSVNNSGGDNPTVVSYVDYDFEDGKIPGIISLARDAIDATMSVVEYNGSKALKIDDATGGASPAIRISTEYLKEAFDDKNAQLVSFDVTIVCEDANGTGEVTLVKQLADANSVRISCAIGEATTIKITRYEYGKFAVNTSTSAGRCEFRWSQSKNPDRALTWYIDNIQRSAYDKK